MLHFWGKYFVKMNKEQLI